MSELEFTCGFCRENVIDITGGVTCCDECINELADDINVSFKDALMILGRMIDARDHPEKMLTIDEFIEKCDAMGLKPTEEDRKWAKGAVKELKAKLKCDEVDNSKGSTDEV